MHSHFHHKQCPCYYIRLYYVSYISCRTFVRNSRLKACPGLLCKVCQEGDQKLHEYKTFGVLSGHSWIETAKGCLKRSSAKTVWHLFKYSRNRLRTMAGPQTGYCHLKGHLHNWGHMGHFYARPFCIIFHSTPSLTSTFSIL